MDKRVEAGITPGGVKQKIQETIEQNQQAGLRFTVFTTADVALLLNCTDRTVRNHIEFGSLRAKKPGGKWVIEPYDLLVFIEERGF